MSRGAVNGLENVRFMVHVNDATPLQIAKRYYYTRVRIIPYTAIELGTAVVEFVSVQERFKYESKCTKIIVQKCSKVQKASK